MHHSFSRLSGLGLVVLTACGPAKFIFPDAGEGPCVPNTVTFDEVYERHFGPSSPASCASGGCHSAPGQAGLKFNSAAQMYKAIVNVPSATDPKVLRVKPGVPSESHLYFRLTAAAGTSVGRMPEGGPFLEPDALAEVAGWICAGAPGPKVPSTDGGAADGGGLPDGGARDGGALDGGLVDGGASLAFTFSPAAGVVGSAVTLTGTGFSSTPDANDVTFNGTAATVTAATPTSLETSVPAGATTGRVRVTVGGLTALSSASFTVVPGVPVPTLTSVTPASVLVGSGDRTLVLIGTNFVPDSGVTLDSSPIPSTWSSPTLLTAEVGSAVFAVAGLHPLKVVNPGPGGGASNALTLTAANPAPSITSLTPSTVPANGAAFSLTLTGTGFVSTSTVELDDAGVSTTFGSSTQLTAQMPVFTSAGTHAVSVRSPGPGGGLSATSTLTVQAIPLPTITTLSPDPAPQGQPFALTVSGANFACADGGLQVLYEGAALPADTCAATQLVSTAPASDAGTATVQVKNPNGDLSNTVSLTLVVPNPAPSISSLVPSSVNSGSGAQTLTVNGANFVASTKVLMKGSARTTTFVSASQLTAPLTAADVLSAGTVGITVQSPAPGGGTSAIADLIVVFANPVPALTQVTPSLLVTGSGAATLTVLGAGFVAASTATFNGLARTTTFVSPTQLSVDVLASDAAAPGTYPLVVTNPSPGGGTSNGLSVVVGNPLPALASLEPCGVVAGSGAQTLTLNGSNFLTGSTVTVNGTAVTPTFVSSVKLTVALPGAVVATAPTDNAFDVVVTNPSPGGGPSAAATLGVATQAATLAANVQPIFNSICAVSCHAASGGSGGLVLEAGVAASNLVGVQSPNCTTKKRVLACGPRRSQSFLVDKLRSSFADPPCAGGPMPASGSLTPAEIQTIVDWVALGAK